MKKKKLLTFFLSIVMVLSAIAIAPTTALATGTAWKSSPASTAGSYSTAKNKYSCSSASSTAQGKNTYTYFQNYTSLGTAFVSNNSRKITIKLMEYDPQNPDDEVKIYTGSFKGRQINSISLSSTTTSGNIEASGNHVCELYIKYQVDKMAGDPATPSISSGLFQYKVGIN